MKSKSFITAGKRVISTGFLISAFLLLNTSYSQAGEAALLLQQSPIKGGSIKPERGVHYFNLNTNINLTAVPRPGYQFVYWLGDVGNPTSNSTVVKLDSPKIIIAVFERERYEFTAEAGAKTTSAPGGGLYASAGDYSRTVFSGGGGGGGRRRPEIDLSDLIEIPEPVTAVIMLFGGVFIFTHKQRINNGFSSRPDGAIVKNE